MSSLSENALKTLSVAPLSINCPVVMLLCSSVLNCSTVCSKLWHSLFVSLSLCLLLPFPPSACMQWLQEWLVKLFLAFLPELLACLIYLSSSLPLSSTHSLSISLSLLLFSFLLTSTLQWLHVLSFNLYLHSVFFLLSASLFFSLDLAVAFPLSSSLDLAIAFPLSFSICLYQEPWLIIL